MIKFLMIIIIGISTSTSLSGSPENTCQKQTDDVIKRMRLITNFAHPDYRLPSQNAIIDARTSARKATIICQEKTTIRLLQRVLRELDAWDKLINPPKGKK